MSFALRSRSILACCLVFASLAVSAQTWEQPPELLPDTARLEWEDALDVRLMDGAHHYIERKIHEAPVGRAQHWNRDLSSPEAYVASVASNRERFREIIGAVDRGNERNHNVGLPPLETTVRMERVGDDARPAVVVDTPGLRISRVRWPVMKGVHGEGLLLEPKAGAVAHVVLLPDADELPEHYAGLDSDAASPNPAHELALRGVRVLVPVLIDRKTVLSGNRIQTHREWVYRQAFHMGRHIIGYEVQKVQAAVDWLEATAPEGAPIGVAGYGEGGLIAMYTSAIDTRIDATLVSGYFGPREAVWTEPIYRNVWSLLREFGDAEIASLIAPRRLVIEYSAVPVLEGEAHKGAVATPSFADVRREVERIDELAGGGSARLISGADGSTTGPWSPESLRAFDEALGVVPDIVYSGAGPEPIGEAYDYAARQLRQVWELDEYTQWLVRDSDHVRNDFYLFKLLPDFARPRWTTEAVLPTTPPDEFIAKSAWYRQYFWEEILGKFDEPLLPPNPRSRLIADRESYVAYDVVLDVFPELFAWGILMLPKDLGRDEQRPLVVLQHGRNGLPGNILDGGYHGIAEKLLGRGFLVFAPHNLYRNEERYRWLDRKANTVKATLFSFLLAQHDQITRWLEALPYVDGSRIAFYGNSYGGESAVRIPPILERYALSICASDFNDWTRKVADTRDWHSFMNTDEWEMTYFNKGSTFSYAEMAYLMLPRPFMAERGHHDTVAPDQWVAYEFAKVRWLYDQLGLPERRAITFFQGGHTMRGEETIEFLHKHLDWPLPVE